MEQRDMKFFTLLDLKRALDQLTPDQLQRAYFNGVYPTTLVAHALPELRWDEQTGLFVIAVNPHNILRNSYA